jgi:4-aminobutyrate aminotransferase-like enzyme/Ser/Thr protein kinase RdoA (MazF antagonist)
MSEILDFTPRFSVGKAKILAHEIFSLKGNVTSIPSERDQNFRIRTAEKTCVLKIANATEDPDVLDFQNQALDHLARNTEPALWPAVCPAGSGEKMVQVKSRGGALHWVRLLTWLPGVPLAQATPHTTELLQDLGRFLGETDRALASFSHPAMGRELYWDLQRAEEIIGAYMSEIPEAGKRKLIRHFLRSFRNDTRPLLGGLRRGVIHNDANDYNVLVRMAGPRDRKIAGVVDLGDMVYSYMAAEPAVAAAYAMLNKRDPLAAAAAVAGGYHRSRPMDGGEVEALYPLICMRLCMSIAIGAHQQKQKPDNSYLGISQDPVWNLLRSLETIPHALAHYTFRGACGLEPCPRSCILISGLKKNRKSMGPVLGGGIDPRKTVVLDLSVESLELGNLAELKGEKDLSRCISRTMESAGARIGVGRYNEPRRLYTSPIFMSGGSEVEESRTVHLGMDLYAEPGTPVLAPLSGRVHSIANNNRPLDYGPTVILEHTLGKEKITFYTLYGHLSRTSVRGLSRGMRVRKGRMIARIGHAKENGGWTPHLHFQIMADMLGKKGDFPGVAAPGRRNVWLSICPDPNLVLGIPSKLFPPAGMEKEVLIRSRRENLGHNLSISYRRPLKIVRGSMQYLYDSTGRAYLDAVNNVPHVGHCHPRVVRAVREQSAVLNTNTRYLHDALVRYSRNLLDRMPDPLSVVYLVCSGSEANELALRLARAQTGNEDFVCVEGGYHGNTHTLVGISSYKFDGPGGSGPSSNVHKVIMPDMYRGPYRKGAGNPGKRYAGHVRDVLKAMAENGRRPAAFICESLLGCGGQIVLPGEYLKEAYRHIRKAGGVCIADEVQVGFGRVGSHFWGFETQGVIPDIVTLGKPIGNGHPLAAVVTTQEIACSFDTGMEYFNTFGGNPVSCAVGQAVLDVIRDEKLQENALRVGAILLGGLRELQGRHALIGDVRGMGLFIGVELVRDRKTLEPADDEADYVINRMRDEGILISTDGPLHNVLKIKPPLVFTEANAGLLVETLDRILGEGALNPSLYKSG